jgi:hypothetical protein
MCLTPFLPSSASGSHIQHHFLTLPLIADYHHAYNLSGKLSTILMPPNLAAEQDPRLDFLEPSLVPLLSRVKKKNPGVTQYHLLFESKVEEREDCHKNRSQFHHPSAVCFARRQIWRKC